MVHGRRSRRAAQAVVALLALCALGAPAGRAAGDPAPGSVYVRAPGTIEGTVRWLEAEAGRIGATQVVVAFDAATFDPPPGLTEFNLQYGFFHDLRTWLGALGGWAARAAYRLRGTSTLARRTLDLKRPGATQRLAALVQHGWWKDDTPVALLPADRWISRALARTENAVRNRDPNPVRMLVLLAGGVTPERWVRADPKKGYESAWRTKLLHVGHYFDEGQVSAVLERYPFSPSRSLKGASAPQRAYRGRIKG
jgi:hypothetical protein